MQGENYQVDMNPLASIPIAVSQDPTQFNARHDRLCSLNTQLKAESKKFDRIIGTVCKLNTLPRAASKWWAMDFKSFYAAIKVKLPLSDVADLGEFFESQQQIIRSIRAEIDSTEFELDELVFNLYGLTAKERQTVRAAVSSASELIL